MRSKRNAVFAVLFIPAILTIASMLVGLIAPAQPGGFGLPLAEAAPIITPTGSVGRGPARVVNASATYNTCVISETVSAGDSIFGTPYYTPSNGVSAIRYTLILEGADMIRVTISDGTDETYGYLEDASSNLTARVVYTGTFGVNSECTYKFSADSGVTIGYFQFEEVAGGVN